jgi:hypothetical protein
MRFPFHLHRKEATTVDIESVIEAAKIAEDVKTLDLAALMADVEDVIHGHLHAAGIHATTGATEPATAAAPLPADVAADLAAETTAEPTDATTAAGSMGAEAADPEGISRAVPGQQ